MNDLTLDNGTPATATVRALRVKEFPAAFDRYMAEDEPGLFALATDGAKPDELSADSYERVARAFMAANSAFFAWCGRRLGSRNIRSMAAPVLSPGSVSSPASRLRPV